MTGLGLFEGKGQVEPLITCFRCGIYCTEDLVNLSLTEEQIIADRLRLTPAEFQNRYADKSWPLEDSPKGSTEGTFEKAREFCRLLESLVTCDAQDLSCFPRQEMII